MRIVAHLFSVLLLVPGLIVAAALLALGHLRSQPDWYAWFNAVFDILLAFFPLAFLGFIAWLGLALMGFSTRLRRAGAICVGLVAAATTAMTIWLSAPFDYASHGGVFVPAAFALVIAIWLAATDWPDLRSERSAAPSHSTARIE
jgi:hypothetical protein